jgi:flagellar assembly protein FliH
MTSPIDLSVLMQGLPVDLVDVGRRGVSLLEFFAIEDEAAERMVSTAGENSTDPAFVAEERAAQTRKMIDVARIEAAAEARIATERQRVEKVCAEFARDRQRYFAAAEAQVVKLALAVAKRILAREVDGDPMHLMATVRAALSRVHDGSKSVLRVRDTEGWAELFSDGDVSVVGDERLEEGECVLETEVGRVELGVAVQVAEIERGFESLTPRFSE